jgi:hypothetical protein
MMNPQNLQEDFVEMSIVTDKLSRGSPNFYGPSEGGTPLTTF